MDGEDGGASRHHDELPSARQRADTNDSRNPAYKHPDISVSAQPSKADHADSWAGKPSEFLECSGKIHPILLTDRGLPRSKLHSIVQGVSKELNLH